MLLGSETRLGVCALDAHLTFWNCVKPKTMGVALRVEVIVKFEKFEKFKKFVKFVKFEKFEKSKKFEKFEKFEM